MKSSFWVPVSQNAKPSRGEHQTALLAESERAHWQANVKSLVLPGDRVEAVEAVLLDVHPVQPLLVGVPARPLAEPALHG